MSPATQRRGESSRKVSLRVTVTTAQKPAGQIAPRRLRVCTCSVRYSAARLWPWGAGTGTRGWRAGQGSAALSSGRRASREGSAGCGAPRRGGQPATRAAAARADSPGRPGAPIGPWRANLQPQLSLQRGAWPQLPGRRRNSGAALGRKYKASWWPLCSAARASRSPAG